MRISKLRIVVLPLLFLGLLTFPLLNSVFGFVSDIKNFENRALNKKPDFNFRKMDSFPIKYEKYYNDLIPLRSRMLKAFNYLNFFTFHKSPRPDFIIIGKDRWLFFTGDEFDAYSGKIRFTKNQLASIKKELEFRKDFLEKRKCKFYFLITPVKASIYPEKLPSNNYSLYNESLGEQLLAYLDKNSSINTVNLYQVLRENKKNYPTYYATDNHWTRMGAFYSGNQFIKQLHTSFPDISPLSLNDFTVIEKDTAGGNTLSLMGNLGLFGETNFILRNNRQQSTSADKSNYEAPKDFPYISMFEEVNKIPHSKKPKLLIISDSFGAYLFPLLSENFSKTVKIWDNWEYKLNENIVENEKPDVLLLVIHEKNLPFLLKNQSSK